MEKLRPREARGTDQGKQPGLRATSPACRLAKRVGGAASCFLFEAPRRSGHGGERQVASQPFPRPVGTDGAEAWTRRVPSPPAAESGLASGFPSVNCYLEHRQHGRSLQSCFLKVQTPATERHPQSPTHGGHLVTMGATCFESCCLEPEGEAQRERPFIS